jgi:flagellar basal body-associated protein FliL
MKKKKNILIIIGFFIISVCFIYILIPKNMYHATDTSGQIVSKGCNLSSKNPYTINLKVLISSTPVNTKIISIAVKDEMTWNLIEQKRFYFVNYQWKNNETPILGQIEHNDVFGDIYKAEFLK